MTLKCLKLTHALYVFRKDMHARGEYLCVLTRKIA